MKKQTKQALLVSAGNITIEVILLMVLWFLFVQALPIIDAFGQQVTQGSIEKSVLTASAIATLVLMTVAYHKLWSYLKSQWLLLIHCSYGRG
ncbi:hypothetical protein [Rhizobium nepotum]|uniref:ABC transmembrane type-1 domain-containing protein n=1 Tax=Rhizobium nepotum 39/7 TaxID=1368418 RepID=A0ABR5CMQ9_9HYPH|nr:hypothetical protein [Rhizobium nepotum]KJF66029.1 hypothetical protein RS75_20375 [Rhizobium nepotum 39/7]